MANTAQPPSSHSITQPNTSVSIGPFSLDAAAFALRRDGEPVRLERRPLELLLVLAESPGNLVTRDQIAQRLWGARIHVEIDMGIHTAVRKLRHALGEFRRVIETVPGKGYRLSLPLEEALTPLPSARPARRVIAVLPFEMISADTGDAYIAEGLTEEAIASIGQIDPDQLAVIGRMSVMSMRANSRSPSAIARELGADLLLEGSVRIEGTRLRVTCKLSEVSTQRQIWAASLDAEPLSMLAFHRDLSATIAAQIQLRLSEEGTRTIARRQTTNAAAYDLYLRGRHLLNQHTSATNLRAIELFQQATSSDPGYALAWAGIAETLAVSPINGDVPHEAVAKRARHAAARARAAEPDLAEALNSAGFVQFWIDWRWRAAEASFRAAILANPNQHNAHRMLGIVLTHLAQHSEARDAFAKARALDPLHAQLHALSAFAAFGARDYAAAIGHARQAIVVEPSFWIGHFQLAQAYVEAGQAEQALNILAAVRRSPVCNSKIISLQGYVFAIIGRETDARRNLDTLSELATKSFVPPYASALIYAGLGDADAAFSALDAAFAVRDVHLAFLPIDPKWNQLRGIARMAELLARCDFEQADPDTPRLRLITN